MKRFLTLLIILGLLVSLAFGRQVTFPEDLAAQHGLLSGAHVTGGDSHNHTGGAGAAVPESGLSLADNTTGDVSISKHGFVPKAPNDATLVFRGDAQWAAPLLSAPTGTGFRHVTGGVEDAAAKLVENADVQAAAGIAESKLSLNYATHANTNDPTADQKAALAGTSGTPSGSNKFVTNSDPRNSDARTPTAHGSGYHTGTIGAWSQIDKTVSDLGDLTTKSHYSLTNIGANTHATIDVHLAAGAPHAGHELLTSKGGAGGYCELDAGAKVPATRLWGAGEDNTKYLRGDRVLAVPTWAEINKTVSSLTDIATRSHTALTDIGTKTHSEIDGLFNGSSTITGLYIARTDGVVPAVEIKGDGDNYNYSGFKISSDEATDKYWGFFHRKYSDLPNGLIFEYFDGTNYYQPIKISKEGKFGLGRTPDKFMDINGYFRANGIFNLKNDAPADADVAAGECGWWFDKTDGAAKVMFKGKSNNGTVVTGSVALN